VHKFLPPYIFFHCNSQEATTPMFRLLLHSILNSTLRDMRNIVPSDSNQAFAFQIRPFLSFFNRDNTTRSDSDFRLFLFLYRDNAAARFRTSSWSDILTDRHLLLLLHFSNTFNNKIIDSGLCVFRSISFFPSVPL
jgi:hypothetical protein